jgi:hypothetical protein
MPEIMETLSVLSLLVFVIGSMASMGVAEGQSFDPVTVVPANK